MKKILSAIYGDTGAEILGKHMGDLSAEDREEIMDKLVDVIFEKLPKAKTSNMEKQEIVDIITSSRDRFIEFIPEMSEEFQKQFEEEMEERVEETEEEHE